MFISSIRHPHKILSYRLNIKKAAYSFVFLQAEDPDTNPKVTYIIKQGPSDLFTIDPKTGVIRTARGLDYELESQYILMVGTLENPGSEPGATTRVIVNVEVRNILFVHIIISLSRLFF